MSDLSKTYDVLVIGGGNAALCAAMTAREASSGYTFVVTDPVTGEIVNGTNGLPLPALGPEGTLTAFYGNPRQVFATVTFEF